MTDTPAPRMSRRWLFIAWGVFALLLIGWIAHWIVLERTARARLQDVIDAQTAAGAEFRIGAIQTHGFPRMLRFALNNVVYAPADRGWRAEIAALDLHINPANPRQALLVLNAPLNVERSNGERRRFSASDARMSLRLQHNGGFERASFESKDARWMDARSGAPRYGADALRAHVRPDPRTENTLQLAIESEGFALDAPMRPVEGLGQTLQSVRAAVAVTQGAAFASGAEGDPLQRWRDAGGQAQIEMVQLEWGPGRFSGDGRLRLDEARRLQGRMQVTFETPGETMQAMAQSPSLSDRIADGLRAAAAAQALAGGELERVLEFRDGWLSVGAVRARELPALY